MKFLERDAGPDLTLVSFCTCDDGRALCPSCRAAAHPDLCRDCGARLLSCKSGDGETFAVCPNCDRFEPTHAA